MRILRKGKGLLETFKCKLGYHEWVAVHWAEFKQRPRRAIFSKKGGRRKAQYYEKRYVKYYCMRCGKKRFGNYKFKDIYPSVIKDYQNGMKVKDICDKYSIGHTTLNNYLRRFNIPSHT